MSSLFSSIAIRRPVDASAISLMALLCLCWGFNYVAAKLAAPGMSLVMQGGVRSGIAALLLMLWARVRGITLFARDGTLWPGLVAGALFAGEFMFIFAGLVYTGASRMAVFVYLAPCVTALGLHFFIPNERLSLRQWAGVLLAFGGVAVAFTDGFASGRASLLGDMFGVIAAVLWAATTVVIYVPERGRGLRQLPCVVLAAHTLSCGAAVRVHVFDTALRCIRRCRVLV